MFDKDVFRELNEIKKSLQIMNFNALDIGGWIPSRIVQRFFNYSDSNMSTFESNNNLTISRVNRRRFYRKDEIIELLNKNKNQ